MTRTPQQNNCGPSLTFDIPIRPQTWKRVNIVHGHGVKAKADKSYQQTIALHGLKARQSVPTWPLDSHYGLIVWVTLANRKSGDVDNYGKAVMDALNKVLWNDDRQIRSLHVILTEPGTPGLRLHVDTVTGTGERRMLAMVVERDHEIDLRKAAERALAEARAETKRAERVEHGTVAPGTHTQAPPK